MSTDAAAWVAIIGNPNTGKSTVFNLLTGKRQRVGNYPGVTVEKKIGTFQAGSREVKLVDLPGAYSLAASSPDERVAVDVLTGHAAGVPVPELVICVVDASNLLRNLFLAKQVADFGLPMVLALNLCDEAAAHGIHINHEALAEKLGVPVVPMVAVKGQGVEELRNVVAQALEKKPCLEPMAWPVAVQSASACLSRLLDEGGHRKHTDPELRRAVFDADSAILTRLGVEHGRRREMLQEARQELFAAGLNPLAAEAVLIYGWLGPVVEGVEEKRPVARTPFTETMDRILTHRFFGLLIFTGMMYVVFQAIYSWARPFMDWIQEGTGWLQDVVVKATEGMPVLQSLLSDGVVAGAGSVVGFLPQILILFFFISLLEDSGYMARAAFLMDKLFSWCGLNGKCFVPLLSSYACAVPGIMSARTIEDPKARLTTILIAPLMSCSARLPVYVLMIGAFVAPLYGPWKAGAVLFAMHFLGLLLALPIAFIFNRLLLRTPAQPFLLEMPPYRWPVLRNVFWRMWERGREFLRRAGTVILALSVIIWALLYFPRPARVVEEVRAQVASEQVSAGRTPADVDRELADPETSLAHELKNRSDAAYIEQSWMGRMGKGVQPVFEPAGFDWKITVGVLASFPAREVIISTLSIIYNLGSEVEGNEKTLQEKIKDERWSSGPRAGQTVFNLPVALAIMVFFALCMQCGATLSIMAREAGLRWAVLAFVYMTALAWAGSVLTYQVASRIFI